MAVTIADAWYGFVAFGDTGKVTGPDANGIVDIAATGAEASFDLIVDNIAMSGWVTISFQYRVITGNDGQFRVDWQSRGQTFGQKPFPLQTAPEDGSVDAGWRDSGLLTFQASPKDYLQRAYLRFLSTNSHIQILAPSITILGVVTGGAGVPVTQLTNGSGAAYLTTANQLLLGGITVALQDSSSARTLQVSGGGIFARASADNNANVLSFTKTRSATLGGVTAVQSGDGIAELRFCGADGTTQVRAALVQTFVDGAVSTGVVPGRYTISTADASGALSIVLDLDSGGNVVLGRPATPATSATDGFVYMPRMNGTPTGVPTSKSNKIPMIYDYAANKLWLYNGIWVNPVSAAPSTLVNGSFTLTYDTSGRALIGTTTAIADSVNAFTYYQAHRAGSTGAFVCNWNSGAARISRGSSGSGVVGTHGASANNDAVWDDRGCADNGTAFQDILKSIGTVDGAPSGSLFAGVMNLQAADASGVLQTRITYSGKRGVGFNGSPDIAKPSVTGSRGGNAALASLLTALASYGLITDSTTA